MERFGKFSHLATEGLNIYIWPVCKMRERISLRVQQIDVAVETKTKDNVFLRVEVSVQYAVKAGGVKDAYYKLTNKEAQMEAYIFDVIRSEVPTMDLDDVFL
jgi:regulator of protease activity HflC (stomatin/prohibitin superfamily)